MDKAQEIFPIHEKDLPVSGTFATDEDERRSGDLSDVGSDTEGLSTGIHFRFTTEIFKLSELLPTVHLEKGARWGRASFVPSITIDTNTANPYPPSPVASNVDVNFTEKSFAPKRVITHSDAVAAVSTRSFILSVQKFVFHSFYVVLGTVPQSLHR
jgi:hypothetical protein